MKSKAIRYRQEMKAIQSKYSHGEITREQAKLEAIPLLEKINSDIEKMTRKLNKKYGLNRSPCRLSFTTAMRNEY